MNSLVNLPKKAKTCPSRQECIYPGREGVNLDQAIFFSNMTCCFHVEITVGVFWMKNYKNYLPLCFFPSLCLSLPQLPTPPPSTPSVACTLCLSLPPPFSLLLPPSSPLPSLSLLYLFVFRQVVQSHDVSLVAHHHQWLVLEQRADGLEQLHLHSTTTSSLSTVLVINQHHHCPLC